MVATRHTIRGGYITSRWMQSTRWAQKKKGGTGKNLPIPERRSARFGVHRSCRGRELDMRRFVALDVIFPRDLLPCVHRVRSGRCRRPLQSTPPTWNKGFSIMPGLAQCVLYEACLQDALTVHEPFFARTQPVPNADRVWMTFPTRLGANSESPLMQWDRLRVLLLLTYEVQEIFNPARQPQI